MKSSLLTHLRGAPLGQPNDLTAVGNSLRSNVFTTLEPTALPVPDPHNVDKGIACAWTSDSMAVVGTKSNHLLQVHAPTRKVTHLPLPTAGCTADPFSSDWGLPVGLSATEFHAASALLALGGAEAEDCRVVPTDAEGRLSLQAKTHWSAPAHYRTCAWLSPSTLVTGGRSLDSWRVAAQDGREAVHCALLDTAENPRGGRTRHVTVSAPHLRLGVLDVYGQGPHREAALHVYDAQLRREQSVPLHSMEPVCVSALPESPAVFAVGGRGLNLLDTRSCMNTRPAWSAMLSGVRSVQAVHQQLTVAYDEAVAQVDLRAPHGALHKVAFGDSCLTPVAQALTDAYGASDSSPFAQAWSPSGTQLLVVGGPLAAGYGGHKVMLLD